MNKKKKKLSIVIPVYNEKNTILEVLKRISKLSRNEYDIEVIVVNDCSTDGTKEILEEAKDDYIDILINHEINQGKGTALKNGFAKITGDVVIVQDADLEYDMNEIPNVVKPIFDGYADVVYGSRFLNKEYKGYKTNRLANKVLTSLSNFMTGLKVTDMETCYKAFRSDFIKSIELKEKRFGFEPEITTKVSKAKLKLVEVPISYFPRTVEEGKKIKLKDGFRTLYCIFKYKFERSKKNEKE